MAKKFLLSYLMDSLSFNAPHGLVNPSNAFGMKGFDVQEYSSI